MENTITLSERLTAQDFLDPAMIASALEYWFSDQEHIRSPFPEYMRRELATGSASAMLAWSSQLNEKARKEINSEMMAEKFEEILFDMGLKMALNEDEKISIRYPFMPRTGDILQTMEGEIMKGASIVTGRRILKKGDRAFLVVALREEDTGKAFENEFELPE